MVGCGQAAMAGGRTRVRAEGAEGQRGRGQGAGGGALLDGDGEADLWCAKGVKDLAQPTITARRAASCNAAQE
jgi:hypothetical protein